MLSDTPLPDMTHAEAIDTLARLYKAYVDPKADEGRIRAEIQRMEEDVDIESVMLDIGKALQLAERGTGFTMMQASQKSLLANAGSSTLEKFYFSAADIDNIIDHSHRFQGMAEDLTSQALIAKATLDADIRAYRRACTIPAYKAMSEPVLSGLFGSTGVQVPRIQLKPYDSGAGLHPTREI